MPRTPPILAALGLTLFAAGASTAYSAEETKPDRKSVLTTENPFRSKSDGTAAPAAANETLEFAGVSQVGNKTTLIFLDKSTKKTRWVAVKETVEGLTVLNYDPRLEVAVVKFNGTQKTLPLKKGTGPVNAPVPMPVVMNTAPSVVPMPPTNAVPAAPGMQPTTTTAAPTPGTPPPPPMTEQARQEQEARMLVSDLLEIGMAQRKAYEEAQRRAADPNHAAANGPVNANGQPADPAATK